MKTINAKKDKNAINVMVFDRFGPVSLGHIPHASGVGAQNDRRTKRNRTRSAQRRSALRDE